MAPKKKRRFAPTDVQEIRASSLAGIDQLRRAGMNVDAPEELGAALRKRQKQATPDKGGCNAFFWLIDGSGLNPSPYGNHLIHAHGLARFGWLADRPD